MEALQSEISSLKQQVTGKDKDINKLHHDLNVTMTTQLAQLEMFENILMLIEEKVRELGKYSV